jgi:hypothetical protein
MWNASGAEGETKPDGSVNEPFMNSFSETAVDLFEAFRARVKVCLRARLLVSVGSLRPELFFSLI